MEDIIQRTKKFYSKDRSVTINALQGHFATSNSHVNYYVDTTRLKIRVSEAKGAAAALRDKIAGDIHTVDTIVCLDENELLGGFLADRMLSSGFLNTNLHETIYVVRPEENSLHDFMFSRNNRIAITGKNCLVLTGTLTTGATVQRILECIEYYGGKNVGVAAVFSTITEVFGNRVYSVFSEEDLPGYATYPMESCPYCAKQIPIEALVNGRGYAVVL